MKKRKVGNGLRLSHSGKGDHSEGMTENLTPKGINLCQTNFLGHS